jgi:hypothetical protein
MNHEALVPRRVLLAAAGMTMAALLVACGGDSGGPDPLPSPTPTPLPPPSVVSTGQGSLDVDFIGRAAPFTTSLTGSLEATVDWTFATNDIDVFLARGDCTPQQFVDTQCNIVAFSDSSTAKPERVRLSAAAPGVYTLLVGNVGPDRESLSWQVVLTPTAASGSPGAAALHHAGSAKARSYRGGPTF